MKKLKSLLAASLMVFGVSAGASAAYPDKAVRWVVPFPAGGGTDIVARLLTQTMGEQMGATFVVENKPGAGTMIGADVIARARPDGYTVGTVDVSTVALNPSLYSEVRYDALKDFRYIGGTTKFPFVLVVNLNVPAKNLQELMDLARQSPGKLTYATPGAGGPNHLGMELFQKTAGLKLLHIPYRGDAPALQDLMGGQVDMYLVNTAASLPYIQSDKVRPIAIAMTERSKALPDVPTFSEAGLPGFEAYAWQGLAAPADTPDEVVKRLSEALDAALATPEVTQRLFDLGVEPFKLSPEAFTEHVKTQGALWGQIIREAGITLESEKK